MHTLLIVLILSACILLAASHDGGSEKGRPGVNSSVISSEQNPQKNQNDPKDVSITEKEQAGLTRIAMAVLDNHFAPDGDKVSLADLTDSFEVPNNYNIPAGLFVTFYKDGKTRACWGSVQPIHLDLVKATVYTAEDALNKEYRHRPITRAELKDIKVQVTVVKQSVPIGSHHELNPLHDGLLLKARGKGAVILPGEASDPHHQIVMARLKAGIRPVESCELYRLKTDVYK